MPGDDNLLLHLPCTTVQANGKLTDTSQAAAHVGLPRGVTIGSDAEFGRALRLERGADMLQVNLSERPEWGLTIALWIRADPVIVKRKNVSVIQFPIATAHHRKPYFVFGIYLVDGKLRARVGQQDVGQTVRGITPEKWHHVALTWDAESKLVSYYVDGKPSTVEIGSEQVESVETEFGVLNYPDPLAPLLIGSNAKGRQEFTGRMSGIRLYGRRLPAQEIAGLTKTEKDDRVRVFDDHHPLGFRVADDSGHPAIAIVDNSSRGRILRLILHNATPMAIELPASAPARGRKTDLVGESRPSEDDHHLEFVFRPGTLDVADVARFSTIDTNWHIHGVANANGTLSIYLSRPHGLVIPPGGVLTIALANVKAIAAGGSRSTQVELRFRHLRHVGERETLGGHRLTHLDVVNQRGLAEAPITAGFIGSNAVLNDGRTRNTLTLYIGNPGLKTLKLGKDESGATPRLLMSFDSGQLNEIDEPWGLGHADEVAEIEIAPDDIRWVVHERESGETPQWDVFPPNDELQANKWINFTLYPIVTGSPSGFSNLYIRYQNIPGYQDGELVVPIEKSTHVYREQPVPVADGLQSPLSERRNLHAFSDSVVIGQGYSAKRLDDNPAPPTYPARNSLTIEGRVGIGTDANELKGSLHVAGDYYGRGHQWLYAYEGDGASGTAYVQARDTSNASSLALQLRTQSDGEVIDALRLSPEGNATVRGNIEDKNGPVVPIGTIVMWSNFQGRVIPSGWVPCDGNHETPDLRGRFVVGAGEGTYRHGELFNFPLPDRRGNPQGKANPGQTGGRKDVALEKDEMPRHSHKGETDVDGLHYHHVPVYDGDGDDPEKRKWNAGNGYQFEDVDEIYGKVPDYAPTTSMNPSAHKHQVRTDEQGRSSAHENLPPYYVLIYIMKVS